MRALLATSVGLRSILQSAVVTPLGKVKAIRPGLWLLPTLTFLGLYVYRPFVLGFYSDDWSGTLEMTFRGAPFSLERFLVRWQSGLYARPLMNLQTYFCSSVLGRSAVAWHVFMIVLIAITYLVLRRFLLALGVKPMAATLASTAWLVFPWSLGYRVWPITSVILLSTICFLCGATALLRRRLWSALAWNAASMLFYEAFFFQFIVILVILAFSTETRRWTLRKAAPLLLALQAGVIALNRVMAHYVPSHSKSYDETWLTGLFTNLYRVPTSMAEAVAGNRIFGEALIAALLACALILAIRTRGRDTRIRLLASVLGIVLSCALLASTGYRPAGLGTLSRTFVCFDIWFAVFLALLWNKPSHNKSIRWVLAGTMAGVFIILVFSTVLRTATWERIWDNEQAVLEAVPVEAVQETDSQAAIIVQDLPSADGFPAFEADYAISAAVRNGIPGMRIERYFYPAESSADLVWDGTWLLKNGSRIRQAPEIWLWKWPANELEAITEPGPIFDDSAEGG